MYVHVCLNISSQNNNIPASYEHEGWYNLTYAENELVTQSLSSVAQYAFIISDSVMTTNPFW